MRALYVLQGALAGIFFSFSPILVRLLPRLDALTIGFYRLAIASAIMLILAKALLRRGSWKVRRDDAVLGAILGGHFALYILSVKHTSVINATVMVNTSPVFAAVISWTTLGLRPSLRSGVGIGAAMMGMALLFSERLSLGIGIVGEAEALLAALLWAVYLNAGRSVRLRSDPLEAMPSIYAASTLTLLIFTLPFGGPMPPVPVELPLLAALAILPTCFGHTLQFSSLKGLRPYQTSALALLEPVTASAVAVPLFAEFPSPMSLLGATIILASIYVVASAER